MSGINKVILVGNVGNDPDVNEMGKSGDLVANFSLATSEKWKDKDTGDTKEKTEWHRVVCYRQLAEIVEQYVKKGSQLYIEGKLQTRKWEDKEGIERYTTEVIVDKLQMLGSRDSGGGNGRDRDNGDDGDRGRSRERGRDRDNEGRGRSRGSRNDGERDRGRGRDNVPGRSAPRRSDPMDDDIPFADPYKGKRSLAI